MNYDKDVFLGYLRIFVQKLEIKTTWDSGYEVLTHSHFDAGLISDGEEHASRELMSEEMSQQGVDFFDEDIKRIVRNKRYKPGSFIEITADAWATYSASGYEHTEYDAYGFLKRVKHRELIGHQIVRFCELSENFPLDDDAHSSLTT